MRERNLSRLTVAENKLNQFLEELIPKLNNLFESGLRVKSAKSELYQKDQENIDSIIESTRQSDDMFKDIDAYTIVEKTIDRVYLNLSIPVKIVKAGQDDKIHRLSKRLCIYNTREEAPVDNSDKIKTYSVEDEIKRHSAYASLENQIDNLEERKRDLSKRLAVSPDEI